MKKEEMLASVQTELLNEVTQAKQDALNKPFKIAIMGQTGVGKSSLINALFDVNLDTDPVRPCTKEIEKITYRKSDATLEFYDLPGLGEAGSVDEKYLQMYQQLLTSSDVVIWAIHADTRSVKFDIESIDKLLSFNDPSQRDELFSKIAFILTKVDLLTPTPWLILKLNGKLGAFAPTSKIEELLTQKSAYFQSELLEPYSHLMTSRTYYSDNFNISSDKFSYDEDTISYKGSLDETIISDLKHEHPEFSSIFDRLYENHRVIPVSSYFKYNLRRLMIALVNRLGLEEFQRFQHFEKEGNLYELDLSDTRKMCNVEVYDVKKDKIIFSLKNQKI